jgi:hypothetical protein
MNGELRKMWVTSIVCVWYYPSIYPEAWKKSVENSVRKVGVRASIWTQDLLNANCYCPSLCSVRTRNSVILCASSGPDRSSSHLNCLQRRFLAYIRQCGSTGGLKPTVTRLARLFVNLLLQAHFVFSQKDLKKNRHSYSTFCFVYMWY